MGGICASSRFNNETGSHPPSHQGEQDQHHKHTYIKSRQTLYTSPQRRAGLTHNRPDTAPRRNGGVTRKQRWKYTCRIYRTTHHTHHMQSERYRNTPVTTSHQLRLPRIKKHCQGPLWNLVFETSLEGQAQREYGFQNVNRRRTVYVTSILLRPRPNSDENRPQSDSPAPVGFAPSDPAFGPRRPMPRQSTICASDRPAMCYGFAGRECKEIRRCRTGQGHGAPPSGR